MTGIKITFGTEGCGAEEQGERCLPFSRITLEEPMKMRVGDWISLAGLVISVAGSSIVIWQLIRARAPEAH